MAENEQMNALGSAIVDLINKHTNTHPTTVDEIETLLINLLLAHFKQTYCEDHAMGGMTAFLYRAWASGLHTLLKVPEADFDAIQAAASASTDMLLHGAKYEGLGAAELMVALRSVVLTSLQQTTPPSRINDAVDLLAKQVKDLALVTAPPAGRG